MAHIDYFFATLSPYAYLAGTRLEDIAARHGATVTYKPLDVIALFSRTGGTPPKDRHPNRQAYRAQDLRRQAAKHGLPINLKPAHWPTNPAPSSYAIIAAQKAGGGDLGQLVHSLLRACWAEERDIADPATLVEIATACGLDGQRLLEEAEGDAGQQRLDAACQAALADGCFGAPWYVVDGEPFWGQDRLDMVEEALRTP